MSGCDRSLWHAGVTSAHAGMDEEIRANKQKGIVTESFTPDFNLKQLARS
jgi:hypothetical protein